MALTTTELFQVSWSGIQTLCAFLQDNPGAKGAWLVDLTFYRQYGYSLCKGIPNEFATGILETNPNKKHTKTMSTNTPKWTCPLQQIWIGMDQGCIGIMTQVMDFCRRVLIWKKHSGSFVAAPAWFTWGQTEELELKEWMNTSRLLNNFQLSSLCLKDSEQVNAAIFRISQSRFSLVCLVWLCFAS